MDFHKVVAAVCTYEGIDTSQLKFMTVEQICELTGLPHPDQVYETLKEPILFFGRNVRNTTSRPFFTVGSASICLDDPTTQLPFSDIKLEFNIGLRKSRVVTLRNISTRILLASAIRKQYNHYFANKRVRRGIKADMIHVYTVYYDSHRKFFRMNAEIDY